MQIWLVFQWQMQCRIPAVSHVDRNSLHFEQRHLEPKESLIKIVYITGCSLASVGTQVSAPLVTPGRIFPSTLFEGRVGPSVGVDTSLENSPKISPPSIRGMISFPRKFSVSGVFNSF